jgi:hypothetical protein
MISHNNLVYMELHQAVRIIITARLLLRLVQIKQEESLQIRKVILPLLIREVRL